MHLDELLTAAVLLLGASAAAIVLFKRAGFGSVLGLLVVGILLGPQTAGPVVDIGPIAAAAELGVVFLLFVIGLELEPRRFWAMRRHLFGLGTLQMVVTGAAIAAVGLALGRPWPAALVLGFGLALSSTAFVLQLLTERDELGTDQGGAGHTPSPGHGGDPAAGDGPAVGTRNGWAQHRLDRLARGGDRPDPGRGHLAGPGNSASRVRHHRQAAEPRGICRAGGAGGVGRGLADGQGGSLTGAGGIAVGVLLSGSPFHQIAAEVTPFKGVLLGLFFISVGMSIDLSLLAERWAEIGALVAALILLKGAVIYGLCRLFALTRGAALRTSLLLTQGGEFGFVLFAAAAGTGVMGAQLHTTALLVISLSMAATPFLVRLGDRWVGGIVGDEALPTGAAG